MAMNRVQFQAGLSLPDFFRRFGSERQCERALEAARWPQGFGCPACGDARHTTFYRDGRKYWQCERCRHQTTRISGTVFEATKLPLTTWFLAMQLLTAAKNNVSALELKRQLGVSYPTAWLLKHKLMQVMVDRDAGLVLRGRVEVDDAYLGGEKPGTPGRGSENKVPFLIALQTDADRHPQRVCLAPIPFTKDAIQTWANRRLDAEARVVSDALPSVAAGLAAEIAQHQAIRTGRGRAAALHPEFRTLNIVLGNLKTAITGTYHAFKFAKYAPRYLGDVQYRFNRRFDLAALLPRLLRAAATTGPYPAPALRFAEEHC